MNRRGLLLSSAEGEGRGEEAVVWLQPRFMERGFQKNKKQCPEREGSFVIEMQFETNYVKTTKIRKEYDENDRHFSLRNAAPRRSRRLERG